MFGLRGSLSRSSYGRGRSSLGETHRRGIHAVAETGWARTIVEDVSKVSVAAPARNRSTLHPKAEVDGLVDVFFRDWLVETGPTGAGFEFRRGVEQRRITADAAENAFVVDVQQIAGECAFGAGVARDFEC